jgi:hypothetical protein
MKIANYGKPGLWSLTFGLWPSGLRTVVVFGLGLWLGFPNLQFSFFNF